jgi:DUF4097 and DUF4098 domain-containing protein YvlB
MISHDFIHYCGGRGFGMRRRPLAGLLAAALTLPLAASAAAAALSAPQGTTIDAQASAQNLSQAWRIADDASIDVHNVRGSVIVSAGDAGQATLSGELGAGSKLVIAGDAQRLDLRVESPDQDHGWFSKHGPQSDSSLVLKVPAGVSLRLELVSADGRVSGIDGKSLNVECVSGKVTLESGAPQVEVECVSGDVTYRATRADGSSRSHLQTVSGDIEASGVGGRVKLETVSGRARADGREVQEFEAGSVSGNVELVAALGAHGRVRAETMSGDIRLLLPPDASAHFEAETFSGSIRTDYGTVKKPEFGPGSSLDVHTGNGDAQVSTETFSGNIEIRKRP